MPATVTADAGSEGTWHKLKRKVRTFIRK
jgi:hypothetical protein